jgi:hypothetical protein
MIKDYEPLKGTYEFCVPSGQHDGHHATVDFEREINGYLTLENARLVSNDQPIVVDAELYAALESWIDYENNGSR